MQSRFNTQFSASSLQSVTAIMVFTVLSRALLLVSLLPLCTQSVDIDIDTLSEITEFFHKNYETGQYAVAINVPEKQCITFDKSTFLEGENDVKKHLQDKLPIHEGTQLIGAGVSEGKHSEYILMNSPNHSMLTRLLTNKVDRCVVFYTLISPCTDRCLSNNENSILPGLDELKAHTGIKAFAFTHIYTVDQNKVNLGAELGKVAERVPLYRCLYKCILCGTPGSSTPIKEECTLETKEFNKYINTLYKYTESNASG